MQLFLNAEIAAASLGAHQSKVALNFARSFFFIC